MIDVRKCSLFPPPHTCGSWTGLSPRSREQDGGCLATGVKGGREGWSVGRSDHHEWMGKRKTFRCPTVGDYCQMIAS